MSEEHPDGKPPAVPPENLPTELGGDWYCPRCDEYLSPGRVTFEERCDVCGDAVQWLEYFE